MSISQKISEKALALGFDKVAIVPANALPHAQHYHDWLQEGRHGTMHYMENYKDLRVNPAVLEKGTKSVVVVLKNYKQDSDMLPGGLRISRYAQGDDYHEYLREQLLALAAFIHAESGADILTRPAVDTAPLLERDLALMAGLGWIGKNAMLINPEIGSYVFISEVLVGIDLDATATRVPDRCGSCSRCIDACPTGAIISPYIIDARRCISYLTIELRGPIPRHLRPLIGNLLFGCDICQAVCPWNQKTNASQDPVFAARESYKSLTPEQLLQFDTPQYVETFRRSAMKRAKERGLKRNAAVVLGNEKNVKNIPLLAERLKLEKDALVRGHIAWALGQMKAAEAKVALQQVLAIEREPYVLDEIKSALQDLEL